MLFVFIACSAVCLTVFLLRQKIFRYVYNIMYKMAQKSMASCDGSVTLQTSKPITTAKQSSAGASFLIDVSAIGQNFDLRKNARFCTPDELQDLYCGNDLA